MNFKEIIEKIKDFIKTRKEKFKEMRKEKKIAIIVGVIAIILAIIFGIKYKNDNKYDVLFSGLDSNDASVITKELEKEKIETKIEGDSIYVPKDQVDKLRLELSGKVSNGSKGFELMDEGSSLGLTDEEFEVKKQRMIQGELEKTIKTFPQVQDARVHITEGEESVFAKESIPGKAAVYVDLNVGEQLSQEQVKSIISLVSASTPNIPKQNVEVINQNMVLLSEGIFDENGKANSSDNSNGIDIATKAERDLDKGLERDIVRLLEPIFGVGKVRATVNADLNFDTNEKTQTIIDPNKVIVSESKSENKSTEPVNTGGTVDNNMNNKGNVNDGTTESKSEDIKYEVGKTEIKTVKAQGELNRITASVAIDGKLDAGDIQDVKDMVSNTIGVEKNRGDDVVVVAMDFEANAKKNLKNALGDEDEVAKLLKTTGYIVAGLLLIIVIALIAIFVIKKKNKSKEIDEIDESNEIDMINQKLEEMEKHRLHNLEDDEDNMTLEEEVKLYASENIEEVTELINNWLNE